jgi:hypothetical protein
MFLVLIIDVECGLLCARSIWDSGADAHDAGLATLEPYIVLDDETMREVPDLRGPNDAHPSPRAL